MKHLKDIVAVWADTRSIVIVSVVAAMYAALRLPFAAFQIIPGFTEIRPGAIVPPLAGILFGPAAAWGSGIGNTIGDVFAGMFSLGSAGGFIGNFLFAYVPYRIWRQNLKAHLEGGSLEPAKTIPFLAVVGIIASLVCAVPIAWFLDMLGLVPLIALGVSILFNNAVVCIILLPILYLMIVPRVRHSLLVCVAPEEKVASRLRCILGIILVVGGAAAVIATALYEHGPVFFGSAGQGSAAVGLWKHTWWWCVLMLTGVALL